MPTVREISQEAKALYVSGCRDAMVGYVFGSTLYWEGRYKDACRVFGVNASRMDQSGYPSFRKYAFYHKMFLAGAKLKQAHPELLKIGEMHLSDAINQGELRGREQFVLDNLTVGIPKKEQFLDASLDRMIDASEDSPELNIILKMESYIKKAWSSRGGGYANTVSEEGALGWNSYLEMAYQQGLLGMRIPGIQSHCAVKMLEVSLGNSAAREYVEEWFLISLDTEINSNQPYQNLSHFLLPRWHGNTESMRCVAWALIDSKRYDTYAPLGGIHIYLRSVLDQYEGSPELIRKHFSKSKETELIIQAAEMTLKEQRMVMNHGDAYAYLCYLNYVIGNYSEAKEYLSDSDMWHIRYYFHRTYPGQYQQVMRHLKGVGPAVDFD